MRYVNKQILYLRGQSETTNPGCSGSGIDIAIEVKDVGTPAPIIPSGSFDEDTSTTMNIAWNAPTGFIENGALVTFPHPSFNASSYDYRYRHSNMDSWIKVADTAATSAAITGLTEDSYQVQVRATNSGGRYAMGHRLRNHLQSRCPGQGC